MPLLFLVILRLPFLRKRRRQPFVYFSIIFCLYAELHNQRSMLSNDLVFHISRGISMRPAAFLLLIFFNTALCSSSVNCSSLMSIWLLMIFWEVYQWFQESFQEVSWNVLPTSEVFLLCWLWLGWYAPGCCFCISGNKVFIFVIWSMSFRCLL